MYKPSNLLRAGIAAGTIGTLLSASALFATAAMADTTGYQTGYTYHQGLATDAGANLVAQEASANTGTTDTTVTQATPSTAESTLDTTDTSVTTPSSASVDTTGVTQAAAVEPAATTDTTAASSVLTSQPFMLALWVVLGLAVLALIAMGISAIVNSMNSSTDEDEYVTRRRVSYQ